MMRIIFLFSFMSLLIQGCATKEDLGWVRNALERAEMQMCENATRFENDTILPRSWKDGTYKLVNPRDWTSGFFPGSLWLMYDLTGQEFFLEQAENYTKRLDGIQFYRGTHDLGFMVYCSFGRQQATLHDAYSAQVIVDAANTLILRADQRIGLIRSWDFGQWNYPVIIDNMMNLEMLFWASRHTGDPIYHDVAMQHADLTIENHFRDDYSSYHVVSYNDDGSVASRGTFQGYSDPSAWARGQAWGLYGYTMCFRETQLERYRQQAEKIASFIMNHPRMPEDLIPYWDYDAPDIPNAYRDASAAAITASALLELSELTEAPASKRYFKYAEQILRNLSSDPYLAPYGANGGFIIQHCVGHLPANSEIDTPLNYADYYYLEAIKRYREMKGVNINNIRQSE